MNDLSHEARSLLAVAREVTVPTERRRQRIKHTVLLRVAAVTAASAGAGVAGATSLVTKVVVTAALATVVTGGAYGVWRWRAPAEPPSLRRPERAAVGRPEPRPATPVAAPAPLPITMQTPAPQSPLGLGQPSRPEPQLVRPAAVASAPPRTAHARAPEPSLAYAHEALAAAPAPVIAPHEAPPSTTTPRALALPAWPTPGPGEAVAPPSAPAPGLGVPMAPHATSATVTQSSSRPHSGLPASGTLVREVALLRRAHEALRDGQPQAALHALGDYDREFPHGTLREERAAIAVIAACQAQPGPQSRARAQELLRRTPGTLLADGVRAACRPPDRDR